MRLVRALSIGVVALATAATVQSQIPEHEVATTRFTLDQTLYFLGADGSNVIVEPGTYRLEQTSQNQLRLVPDSGKDTLVIQALPTTHQESISIATALALPPDAGDDAFHLVLLLPDGSGLDAAGSPTAVRTRGFSAIADQARIMLAMQAASPIGSASTAPSPTAPTTATRPAGIQPPPEVMAPPPTTIAPPPPSTPAIPPTVDCGNPPTIRPYFTINCNGPECRQKLVDGLHTPHALIKLWDGVDLDLSNLERLPIACGVEVIGTRSPQNPGPRLFTKTRPQLLFEIVGNNVRLLNFRLQGPHLNMVEGDANLEKGIRIDSQVGVEIANMELSGWSGAAISISDGGERVNYNNAHEVKIHDNFIHHNQHDGGWGYGIVLGHGAYALIERNLFDFNRHAISADGRITTGYYTHRNLVLKGGGLHRCVGGACTHTHQFDMHGRDSCGISGIVSDAVYNCGAAGEYMEITYNAFQYREDNAFKLRGTPFTKPRQPVPCTPGGGAFVGYNAFAHEKLGDAVSQTESGLVTCGNRSDIDSFGRYGVCDFDGDGQDDLFLATGVTWWYSHHSGKEPWAYLNSAGELLSQVGLGYFDNDKKCDVLAVQGANWVISKGGTGTWQALGSYGVPINQLRFEDFNRDGITDAFRRAPDGKWSVMYSPGLPGAHSWTPLGSSSYALSELQFGDFNGDGITDVLSTSGGQWSVSWGGAQSWQRLNKKLTGDLDRLKIADLNGNGIDDILLYWGTDTTGMGQPGYWLVSWDGRSDWKNVPSIAGETWGFVGRFDSAPGADLLVLNRGSRMSHISSAGKGPFVQHSRFAY